MKDEVALTSNEQKPAPRWRPISAIDRRVLGVLVEKAKTTPDGYPMTINAICTGANQKNNRYPLMQLEPDDVEESLTRLRQYGAVAMVEGSGRTQKYRHYFYDWLGVDKVESAVMAELLLRGAQTEGELRGRAARMEPIADLGALRPVLQSLKAKGLLLSLSPEGRGHVVSHALYEPRELEKIKAEASSYAAASPATHDDGGQAESSPARPVQAAVPVASAGNDKLIREVAELRDEVAQLRQDLADLTNRLHDNTNELERLKSALGV
jgi:uncharacterized protein YceH (UPF0502 family)